MSISVQKSESNIAIQLGDRFDFSSVEQFRAAYESLSDLKRNKVSLDFTNTQYIDSSALGMLINAKNFFDQNEVKVVITNTNDQIKKILSISRFDAKFDIH